MTQLPTKNRFPSLIKHRSLAFLDAFIWCSYLLLLFVASFLNELYSSQSWLQFSGCIYLLSGLAIVSALNGGCCNWNALVDARYTVMLLCAMLLLLILQMSVPLGGHSERLLLSNSTFQGASPNWFEVPRTWSIVPEKTRWLFNSEVLIFSSFALSIAVVSSRRRIKQLLIVLLMAGLTHSLVGIFTKYDELILVDIRQLDGHFSAARGWFINRNHFAAFISLCLLGPLSFQFKLLLTQKPERTASLLVNQLMSYRVLYLLCLILGVVALVLSQSRAGFLSFSLSLLLVLGVFVKSKTVKSLRFRGHCLILVMIIGIGLIVIYFGAELLLRFSSNSLLGERASQWELTWLAIKQAWLIGYGGNSYADVFQIYRGYQDFRQVLFNQSHNDYLHIWLEQGLLGLGLWISVLFLVLRAAYKNAVSSTSALVSAVMISTVVVILAALAQAAVDFNLQILNIRYYFFVIMSLVFSVPTVMQSSER